jgi:hypothetical protein
MMRRIFVKRLIFLFYSFILLAGFLSGCTLNKSASTLGDNYYEAVQNKDYNTALTYFSSAFYSNISQSDWLQTLQNINTKLGDLESYKLNGWNENVIAGANAQSGTTYTLQYQVVYANETDNETLTMFQPTGGQLQIEKWQTSSTILLK